MQQPGKNVNAWYWMWNLYFYIQVAEVKLGTLRGQLVKSIETKFPKFHFHI